MFLKKVKVNGFGKILNKEFNFKPGMNIVFGPNESGKTTLAKFILHTLSTPSKDSLKYKPWNSDIFGGFIETSDGIIEFGETNGERYDRELLESISFLMEDDDLESLKIEKGVIEKSIKKKSEKTETGKIIKTALSNLESTDLNRCFTKITSELEKIKAQLEELKNKIKRKNELYLEKKKIIHELNVLRNKLSELQRTLETTRNDRINYLNSEIEKLKIKLDELKKIFNELQWVEKIEQNTIFEISSIVSNIENIRTEISKLESEEAALTQLLKSKNAEIDSRFKLLGATSHEDLESISLRLKHLSLLTKMYGEGISETKTEEPLWHIFIEDPLMIDRAEEEEQKYTDAKNLLEQQKLDLQNRIEKLENNAKYSKDLSILSTAAGVVLLALGLLFNKLAIFMYIPSVVFLGIAIILLINWRKKITNISVLQEKLVETTIRKKIEPPQVWKILTQYGIKNLKELRKKYAEFLEWKATNLEKQRKLIELKEIEQEIIKELSKFNVNGYAQMIISAVDNLQRTFNEVQELIYEKESIERKLAQIKGEYLSLQKNLKNLHEILETELKKHGITREDIENYRKYFEEYLKVKNTISEYSSSLRELKEQLHDEESDSEIRQLKSNILLIENSIKKLEEILQKISNEYETIVIDYSQINELIRRKDELEFKLTLISLLSSYVPTIFEHIKQSYSDFVENYYKVFSEEFTKFFNHIAGQSKNFFVTPELTIKILVEGDLKEPSEYLSGSTKDLIIFGIKNALDKAFYNGNLPLIIDNTLIRLDDCRLSKVCEYLIEESNYRQLILLTSDKRIIESLEHQSNIIYLEG